MSTIRVLNGTKWSIISIQPAEHLYKCWIIELGRADHVLDHFLPLLKVAFIIDPSPENNILSSAL